MILHISCDIGRNTRARVANDEHIDLHCLECVNGVENALALFSGRHIDVKIENIGAEPLRRQVERCPRPRAGLVEKISDRAPCQCLRSDCGMALRAQEFLGLVEDPANVFSAETLERQEVP